MGSKKCGNRGFLCLVSLFLTGNPSKGEPQVEHLFKTMGDCDRVTDLLQCNDRLSISYMSQRLKRWESPRKEGRNDKGKGGSARQRQLKKRTQMLRQKLKDQSNGNSQGQNKKGENYDSLLFLWQLNLAIRGCLKSFACDNHRLSIPLNPPFQGGLWLLPLFKGAGGIRSTLFRYPLKLAWVPNDLNGGDLHL